MTKYVVFLFLIASTNFYPLFFGLPLFFGYASSFLVFSISFFLLIYSSLSINHGHVLTIKSKKIYLIFILFLVVVFFAYITSLMQKTYLNFFVILLFVFLASLYTLRFDFINFYLRFSLFISISNLILFLLIIFDSSLFFKRLIDDGNHIRLYYYNFFGAFEDGRPIWFFGEPSDYIYYLTPALLIAYYRRNWYAFVTIFLSCLVTSSGSIILMLAVLSFLILLRTNISLISLFKVGFLIFFVALIIYFFMGYYESVLYTRFFNNGVFEISRIQTLYAFFHSGGQSLNNFLALYSASPLYFFIFLCLYLFVIFYVYFTSIDKDLYFAIFLFFLIMSFVKTNPAETIIFWGFLFCVAKSKYLKNRRMYA